MRVQNACLVLGLFLYGCGGSSSTATPAASAVAQKVKTNHPGLLHTVSENSHAETVERLVGAIESKGFRVFTTIDHQANAASVDLVLAPSTVIIFGNPKVGTRLMQDSPSHAIDLPQKFLVWQHEDGRVMVTYNDPHVLASRHQLARSTAIVDKVAGVLAALASAASLASADGGLSLTVWADLDDVTGLGTRSQVVMAGVPVGELSDMELVGIKGRVTMKLRNDLVLWKNAVLYKKNSSLLGDYYLEIAPGSAVTLQPNGEETSSARLTNGQEIATVEN